MQRIRFLTAALASLAYWTTGALVCSVLGAVLWLLLPRDKSKRAGQRLLKLTFRGFVVLLRWFGVAECEFRGFERLRDEPGGFIVAPNHPAIWDAVFVLSKLDGLTCIMKASLLKNPLLTGGALLAGFIPNKPEQNMVKRCTQTLQRGGRLLLFPEGTRTRKHEGCMNECRGGIALMAKHSGATVWPVHVETNSDYGAKGWPLWRLPEGKVRIRMTVGDPLSFEPGEDLRDFLKRLRATHVEVLQGRGHVMK